MEIKTVSYSERLHHLGIHSLELRKLYFDLIYCCKIVFGLVLYMSNLTIYSHSLLHHVLEDIFIKS